MPSYRHHDFGNLYIHFNVKFPEHIAGPDGASSMTEEQIKALESVLPPRMQQPSPPVDAMVDDAELDDVDGAHEDARAHGAAGEDEDEEMGGERVQCASQ